jgi:hypothetical protein
VKYELCTSCVFLRETLHITRRDMFIDVRVHSFHYDSSVEGNSVSRDSLGRTWAFWGCPWGIAPCTRHQGVLRALPEKSLQNPLILPFIVSHLQKHFCLIESPSDEKPHMIRRMFSLEIFTILGVGGHQVNISVYIHLRDIRVFLTLHIFLNKLLKR